MQTVRKNRNPGDDPDTGPIHPPNPVSASVSASRAQAGSFRDPAGTVFRSEGEIYRQVNICYGEDYARLMGSGLYERLTSEGLLIPHEEAHVPPLDRSNCLLVLKPVTVPFVSYPFEWCFGQYQAAALATLKIQKTALEYGMTLKDASAYNIQFYRGNPVLIDTLSFTIYRPGAPWAAYRQFCQHFLAPLLLMAKVDIGLGGLMRVYLDGIPPAVAGAMLSFRTFFSLPILIHIHLQGWAQRKGRKGRKWRKGNARSATVSKHQLAGILDSLESLLGELRPKAGRSQWADYYAETNYSAEAFAHKQAVVKRMLGKADPKTVWDLGANTGLFSRLASDAGIPTVAFDLDPLAVECNWKQVRANGERALLPLVMDFGNPTPGIGWENREREPLLSRADADTVMALALVHHLAIGLNTPLGHIARFLAGLSRSVIIEFVPKSDSQVKGMLASREDVFPGYTESGFETAFAENFKLVEKVPIRDSRRTLYLYSRLP